MGGPMGGPIGGLLEGLLEILALSGDRAYVLGQRFACIRYLCCLWGLLEPLLCVCNPELNERTGKCELPTTSDTLQGAGMVPACGALFMNGTVSQLKPSKWCGHGKPPPPPPQPQRLLDRSVSHCFVHNRAAV